MVESKFRQEVSVVALNVDKSIQGCAKRRGHNTRNTELDTYHREVA